MATLYLIRHGIAADRELYENDADRPLTDQGDRKTQKIAKQFKQFGLKFDIILTSPLVRAAQTAKILYTQGLSASLEEFSALGPDGEIQDWLDWYQDQSYGKNPTIALVGHQPNLGNWAEILVWGEAREVLVVKKAGVIGLTLPETGSLIGKGQLFWLTPPRFMI